MALQVIWAQIQDCSHIWLEATGKLHLVRRHLDNPNIPLIIHCSRQGGAQVAPHKYLPACRGQQPGGEPGDSRFSVGSGNGNEGPAHRKLTGSKSQLTNDLHPRVQRDLYRWGPNRNAWRNHQYISGGQRIDRVVAHDVLHTLEIGGLWIQIRQHDLGTALERQRSSSPTRAARSKHHDSAPRQHGSPLSNPSKPRSMRMPRDPFSNTTSPG